MDNFDVVILGGGSAGEAVATSLSGRSVAVVEVNRVGGECPFVACMPSKALLHSAHIRQMVASVQRFGAASRPLTLDEDRLAYAAAVARRDEVAQQRNDQSHVQELAKSGVTLLRGRGTVLSDHRLEVDGRSITYQDLVIATGSAPAEPPIDGLAEVDYWTSDQALSSVELPDSIAILGAGPVGCELAQMYATFGATTLLFDTAESVLSSEGSMASALVLTALHSVGVKVHLATRITRVMVRGQRTVLVDDSGRSFEVERLLAATGRSPNLDGLGLDNIGIDTAHTGIEIDEHCRVKGKDHVWAAGDVTAIAPFTHTANYQGRIVANNILGREVVANYSAVPRAVYTSPSVTSVGLSLSSATIENIDVKSVVVDLNATSRSLTDGTGGGYLQLIASMQNGVLVGASAGGPRSEEWIGEATLAIRAKIPLDILSDVIHPFPSFAEAYEPAIRELMQAWRPFRER